MFMVLAGLSAASLFTMPVHAACECGCSTTRYNNDVHVIRSYGHRVGTEILDQCITCGEITVVQSVDWENHTWQILSSEDRGYGLIMYDVICTVCGGEDTIPNPH